MTPAGQAPGFSPFLAEPIVVPNAFNFDLQMFADDDDDLGDAPNIDIGALSDDPGQLKGLIRNLLVDNKNVRKEAGKRRTSVKAAQAEIDTLKSAHQKALDAVKAEGKTLLDSELEKVRNEHKTALDTLTAERDGVVTEREALKTERETLNRSNGQLRSKFREQFVDQQVRNELEKRGAHNIDVAMKVLDVGKLEFDEEKLALKDPAALTTSLDALSKDHAYLFGTQRTLPRGTTPGRGNSDNSNPAPANTGKAFDDQNLSIEQITQRVLADQKLI